MTEQEYKEVFEAMTFEQLVRSAVILALECDRKRRELDDLQGVIR